MKILIVDDDFEILNLNATLLENLSNNPQVKALENPREALSAIQQENFALVISDHDMPEVSGEEVCRAAKKKLPHSKLILHTKRKKEELAFINELECHYINKPCTPKKFLEQVQSFLEIKPSDMAYTRVKSYIFALFEQAPCDLFVQLADTKFVRVVKDMDSDFHEIIDKYLEKDVSHFYIKSSNLEDFHSKYKKFFRIENLSSDATDERKKKKQLLIRSLAKDIGFSQTTVRICNGLVREMRSELKGSSTLLSRLNQTFDSNPYVFDHSHLLAICTFQVLEITEWGTRSMQDTLIMASLIHDVSLDADIEEYHTGVHADVQVQKHVSDVLELFQESKFATSDLIAVISQHHERPDGSGYPKKITDSRMTSLSRIFIYCHDFIDLLFQNQFDTTQVPDILDILRERFEKYPKFIEIHNRFKISLLNE